MVYFGAIELPSYAYRTNLEYAQLAKNLSSDEP